jgi:hypothetical protein
LNTIDLTRPEAIFIGHYTLYGPQGEIVGDKDAAQKFADELQAKWPHALCSDPHRGPFQKAWHIKIWSKLELVGNE